jgi:hypothetical protein
MILKMARYKLMRRRSILRFCLWFWIAILEADDDRDCDLWLAGVTFVILRRLRAGDEYSDSVW